MTPDENISQRLQAYEAAFDFYMDAGRLPDDIPQGDILGGYISQTIDDNPQLSSQDPLWREILKDEMMKFLDAMLQIFQPIEQKHREEISIIGQFASESTDVKRAMWGEVAGIVTAEYRKEEVNLEGYAEQIRNGNQEAAVAALVKDWRKACDQKEEAQKRKVLEANRRRWESHVRECGRSDYEARKKMEKFFYSYPQLQEIVRIMGREQPEREDEMDETVRSYLPLLPSPPRPAAEIEEVALGNDLQHLLPTETAILSDRQTESLFFLKYATRQLQLFANRPKEESRLKTELIKEKKPRLEKGPIIVAVDTSGSMEGRPQKIAFALLRQLLQTARRQKRDCFLMSFSVRSKFLDLSLPRNWRLLDKFLEDSFTGGTDGEEMLRTAIGMLQTKTFGMADVLVISDFYFPLPVQSTRKKIETEHRKGTRFYGLRIGNKDKDYEEVLDRVWEVK